MTAWVRKFIKWFYTCFAVAAIAFAVIVQAGRSFSPLLADHPAQLARYFSEKLNATVTLGAINAEWVGLKPMLNLQNLHITSHAGQPIFALENAQLRLDLLGSVAHFRLVWSVLQLNQVVLDFVQQPDGTWRVQGMPKFVDKSAEEQAAQLASLVDMLVLSRRIEFSNAQLNFHFVSGAVSHWQSPLVRMENADDFHRLSLRVNVDEKADALTLTVEGRGDPRRKDKFTSKGYVHFTDFPTNEPIAATTALLLHGINAQLHSEGTLNASVWFSSRAQHEGFDLVGKLDLGRLSVPMMGRELGLDRFSTDLLGHWFFDGHWQLALQNLGAEVKGNQIEKLQLSVSADSLNAPLRMQIQSLDVGGLTQTLDSAGVLGNGRLQHVMQTLSPQGRLENLQIALPLQNIRDWELQANLRKAGVNAWQGVPALRKVDGFVHATAQGGFVNLDSQDGFSMHYYPTYTAPMEFKKARGQVAWALHPEQNQIYVNSGLLSFVGEQEEARGYMWLSLPWLVGTADVDLYLQVGANHLAVSKYKTYVPAVVPSSLLSWLDKSLGGTNSGVAEEAGFLYRGTLSSHDHAAHSHQLYLDIKQAQLNYHPQWPALNQINGRLLLADDQVSASIDSARVFDSDVQAAQVEAFTGKGGLLHVDASISGPASDGMRTLKESMLRHYVGASLDSWQLNGHIDTQLKLAVPLDKDAKGGEQQVDIALDAPNFTIGNLRLAMQDVNGVLHFNQTDGLSSDVIQARLFNKPVNAALSTEKQADGSSNTLIKVNGEVSSEMLAKWSLRPEVLFAQGNIPYRALVSLHSQTPKTLAAEAPFADVRVTSDLQGVKVDLPSPYGKQPSDKREFSFAMSLEAKRSLVDIRYGDDLQALLVLDPTQSSKLTNAAIFTGEPAVLSAQPTFLVGGRMAGFDVDAWKAIWQRYQYYGELTADTAPKKLPDVPENPTWVAGLPFLASLTLERYPIGPLPLENLAVKVEKMADAWRIGFANPVVEGRVSLPNDTHLPMGVDIESLRLTSQILGLSPADPSPSAAGSASVVETTKPKGPSLDPRNLPLANIAVKSLYMDEVNYGNWSLLLRPTSHGAVFEKIQGVVKGITISGADDPASGARIEWSISNTGGATTHFVGALSAANISDVLLQWGKPDSIDSTSAHARVDALWAGDPQDFSLAKINGTMDVALEHGRFKRSPSVGSDGFLRLMGVLNFDSLARRLRLDFSDLYSSGLAYDQIDGKVRFDQGTMTFTEPLLVQTPSSRLQMAGSLDVAHETLNTHLVATVPVVRTYALYTALLAGWPVAVVTYAFTKLFKKQVDRATSISYRIVGDWSDPKMTFDRLFESEDDLRKPAK